jgi:thiol-disulfide isomerase/thioredoxin
MKNFTFLVLTLLLCPAVFKAQSSYDIKLNLKGCKDSTMFLVRYQFDQQFMADTSLPIKNGLIQFKSNKSLDKGMYALVSTGMVKYIDFFINENDKFSITGDFADLANTLKSTSPENELMFSYARFMSGKEAEYRKILKQSNGKNKSDSLAFMKQKTTLLNEDVKKFNETFMAKHKNTFVVDFLNLRTEKYAKDVPKASNGRPDSLYQYYYYKSHYLDGINFKDDRIIRVPFFADRIKKYTNEIILQQPDTIIKELDKILGKSTPGGLIYNTLVSHYTYKFEQNKVMSFDQYGKTTTFEKVFIHLADNYVVNGKSKAVYDEETTSKIKEKVDILRNLLPETKVTELFMIDTIFGKRVLKMGFDTAKSSKSLTDLYYKNIEKLTPMFKTLYQVNAKYTVLVFWAVDCDHCQKEIPLLQENLKQLKGKVDVKVFAVQTKDDLFEDWRKFIIEKKLEFINVFDPVHLNNTKEKFDITSTPVIYLLDKDKRIKGKKLSADQTLEIIKNLEKIQNP